MQLLTYSYYNQHFTRSLELWNVHINQITNRTIYLGSYLAKFKFKSTEYLRIFQNTMETPMGQIVTTASNYFRY